MPVYPGAPIQQQRHHHRRVMPRAAVTVHSIGGIKRRQIQPLHRRQHKPREMVFGQPLPQIRRHQQHLLAINRQKVHGHAQNRPQPPGRTPFMRQPPSEAAAARGRVPLAAAPAATRSRPWPGLDAWVGANRATAGRPVGSAEAATWPGSLDRAHPLPAQGRSRDAGGDMIAPAAKRERPQSALGLLEPLGWGSDLVVFSEE
jgi:hypothetical protein